MNDQFEFSKKILADVCDSYNKLLKENTTLRAENAKLKDSCSQWYEQQLKLEAELSALRNTEQEPFAWATFDGEGCYDLRLHEYNESYKEKWERRNPNHVKWVKPLYLAAPPIK